MYEISIEATLQIILQTAILLFKLFNNEPSTLEFLHDQDYTMQIISITTSFVSILYGLCSYKINVIQQEQKLKDKFVLMIRNSADIIAR